MEVFDLNLNRVVYASGVQRPWRVKIHVKSRLAKFCPFFRGFVTSCGYDIYLSTWFNSNNVMLGEATDAVGHQLLRVRQWERLGWRRYLLGRLFRRLNKEIRAYER